MVGINTGFNLQEVVAPSEVVCQTKDGSRGSHYGIDEFLEVNISASAGVDNNSAALVISVRTGKARSPRAKRGTLGDATL